MKLFGLDFARKEVSLNQLMARLEQVYETTSGIAVTPESCEESPTVQAVVNAIASAISTLPVHVLRQSGAGKEREPNHPVQKLLQRPNEWQTSNSYWLDATSVLVRYGRFIAVKGRGVTGPIRRLVPVHPASVQLKQDDNLNVSARVTMDSGEQKEYGLSELHYVRGRASDFLTGDSPVMRARDAIALEIAAQRFGAGYFGNGAMPGIIFKYAAGFRGMNADQRNKFIEDFHSGYGGRRGIFRAMLMPQGIEQADSIKIENDKAQFLETRKLQRNIIAGAFGVPPHLVGDLERGTFTNIEAQSRDFQQKVVLPYVRMFESAMERDLLTDEDRRSGIVIRFNMDGSLRGAFKEQQEGLKIMREGGALSPDEWREMVGMNPLPEGHGGDSYWQQGPSGQGATDAARDPV